MSKPQAQALSALKLDLFVDAARKQKIQPLGDPLQVIARDIDFDHLAQITGELLPRGDVTRDSRPTYPTAVMVHNLILKYLYSLSEEQMECQLLDRMRYQRLCLLAGSSNFPDRNTLVALPAAPGR